VSERPAGREADGQAHVQEREGGDGRGENWEVDWAGWLARKGALRRVHGSLSAAPPLKLGRGLRGPAQMGSGSAGSGR